MARLLFLLLLLIIPGSGLITAEDPIEIKGQLGSDLHLPVADACRSQGSYFEIFDSAMRNIGTYHGDLQPMKGYEDRLTYDTETCDITLKSLSGQDGTRFTVKFYKDIDGKPTWHAINYRIHISGPLPSPSYTRETTHIQEELAAQNTSHFSTDDPLRLASLCLSLDMTVNALFPMVLWIIQKSRNKMEEDAVNFGCLINSCFTFLFQTISFSTMYRGNSCGLFLVLVPIILLLDTLIGISKYYEGLRQWLCEMIRKMILAFKDLQDNETKNSTCKKKALMVWSRILLLIQIFFPFFVGHLYYMMDNNILSRLGEFWFWPCLSVLISFAVKTGVFRVAYCYKRKPQSSAHPPEQVKLKTPPGDPEGDG